MPRLLPLLLVPLALAACATRGQPRVVVDLGRADALVREGCYDCLIEARGIYASVTGRRAAAMVPRQFEVQLLIVLREKELAIDSSASLAAADALGARLAAPFPAAQYLDIVRAIPGDSVGIPRMDQPASAQPLREAIDRFAAVPDTNLSPPVQAYLSATLDCADTRPRAARREPAAPGAVPLLVYRHAVCAGSIDVPALERLRVSVPRFTEAALFQGRAAIGAVFSSDGRAARDFLAEAYGKLAGSSAVTMNLGTVNQALGDCRTALRYFDETVALRDHHEDARLGRTICLTYGRERQRAISEASALLELGSINQGEALYWRAWNLRDDANLARARDDIDRARTLLYNSRVLTLAGMIEHDQTDLPTAERDLIQAKSLDGQNCVAAWYLGLVRYKGENWVPSATAFGDAHDCYAASAADSARRRADMAARSDLDQSFRERQLAGFDTAIQEDRSQESAAALNAALNFARGGDITAANSYMTLAAVDPARRNDVEALRRAIAGRNNP